MDWIHECYSENGQLLYLGSYAQIRFGKGRTNTVLSLQFYSVNIYQIKLKYSARQKEHAWYQDNQYKGTKSSSRFEKPTENKENRTIFKTFRMFNIKWIFQIKNINMRLAHFLTEVWKQINFRRCSTSFRALSRQSNFRASLRNIR